MAGKAILVYRTDCPSCGRELQAVALDDPMTAPWLCALCKRGFWAAELTDVARGLYRVRQHDWGRGAPSKAVRASVQTEWLQAQERGVSLRADQLHLAPVKHLTSLLERAARIHPDFAETLRTEIAGRA